MASVVEDRLALRAVPPRNRVGPIVCDRVLDGVASNEELFAEEAEVVTGTGTGEVELGGLGEKEKNRFE